MGFSKGIKPFVAAIREFSEETGKTPIASFFVFLGEIDRPNGKKIWAWAFEGDWSKEDVLNSNHCEIEYPPKSGQKISISELDQVKFFTIEEAREKIHKSQRCVLEEFEKIIWVKS